MTLCVAEELVSATDREGVAEVAVDAELEGEPKRNEVGVARRLSDTTLLSEATAKVWHAKGEEDGRGENDSEEDAVPVRED